VEIRVQASLKTRADQKTANRFQKLCTVLLSRNNSRHSKYCNEIITGKNDQNLPTKVKNRLKQY
jgi:hypothetical protein